MQADLGLLESTFPPPSDNLWIKECALFLEIVMYDQVGPLAKNRKFHSPLIKGYM